jgi:hypothetical protein
MVLLLDCWKGHIIDRVSAAPPPVRSFPRERKPVVRGANIEPRCIAWLGREVRYGLFFIVAIR